MTLLGAFRDGGGEQTAGVGGVRCRGGAVRTFKGVQGLPESQRYNATSEARGGPMHMVSCRMGARCRGPGCLCQRSIG